jgi:hypothetical protein
MFRGITVNQYLEDLNSLSIPVYMQKSCDVVARSTNFPVNTLVDIFGRYFTSSHSWMLAFAIYLGFKIIGIFGVNMDEPSHIDKRPCMEHYIGIAKGKGIEVIIPDNSPLCKDNTLYAYES